jgi:lysosomal alpha-mannosidase
MRSVLTKLIIIAFQSNSTNIHVFYSTPGCYTKAVNAAQKRWPSKRDDFFPYADKVNSYWTGYFTSRPAFKYMIRVANSKLQVETF